MRFLVNMQRLWFMLIKTSLKCSFLSLSRHVIGVGVGCGASLLVLARALIDDLSLLDNILLLLNGRCDRKIPVFAWQMSSKIWILWLKLMNLLQHTANSNSYTFMPTLPVVWRTGSGRLSHGSPWGCGTTLKQDVIPCNDYDWNSIWHQN